MGGESIGGQTADIKFLEGISKSNSELAYIIINRGDAVFKSDNFKAIKKEFQKLESGYYKGYNEIKYFSTKDKVIFHFRNLQTIISIIDLLNYNKHALLNFKLSNGINTVIPSTNTSFTILEDNLTPIFNSREDYSNSKHTMNGPGGIFHEERASFSDGIIGFYEKTMKYNRRYYYNGGRGDKYKNVYNTKFAFLINADAILPEEIKGINHELYLFRSERGYFAVISLVDFNPSIKNIATFEYDDILALEDLGKIQEYKISPQIVD